ncbi:unnamed protein product, partial [Medioppia subpectinata]
MIVTYFRGAITESDPQIPRGLMAVVGLSRAEALNACPKGVFIACNNAKESVVISGPTNEMKETIDLLNKKGVFVRQLESSEIPFHSEYLRSSAQPMVDAINKYMPNPRLRSKKWLSTSVMVSEPEDVRLRYASAEYFVYNFMNPVQFYDRLKHIPTGAVVLELSPHSLFKKTMAESVDNCQYISLISKNSNTKNIDQFLSGISKLYELGFNPSVERLYPPIQWPVPRSTPSISSLLKWDHSRDLSVYTPKWPQNKLRFVCGDMNVVIDMTAKKDDYLCDHVIDGNNLFPAVGYLMLAWRQMAAAYGQTWDKIPVVFSKCQFLRAIFLTHDVPTRLTVKYYQQTGDYMICENDNMCAVGTVRRGADDMLTEQHLISDGQPVVSECEYRLDRESIKKELHIRGYEYSKGFQSLTNMRTNDFRRVSADIEWTGNMVTFLDGLLQLTGCLSPFRKLVVPVMIDAIRVDPNTLFEALKRNRLADEVVADGGEKLGDNFLSDFAPNNASERFAHFSSRLPVVFDSCVNCVLTYGAEVYNMVTAPITRKTDPNMVLERHEFIPNDDNMAIDDSHRKLLNDNIEVCKAIAVKIREMGFKEMKCDFNYRKISEEVIQSHRNANIDNNVMFKILDKIHETIAKQNIKPNDKFMIKKYSHHLWELDLQDLMQDLSDAIESNGFLLTVFRYKVTEPEIALNSLFGNSVTDSDLEKRINDFITFGNEMGLRVICSKCDTIGSKAVLFRKVSEPILPDKQNIIQFNGKCEQWFPVLKDRLLMASELVADSPRVWLIANDSCINGVMGLAKSLRLEPGGEYFRYVFIYDKNTTNTDIDFNIKPFSDILANDLVSNVIRDGRLGSYRYQSFGKDFDKIQSNDYYLGLGKGRDLSSFEWTDATSAPITESYYDMKNKLRKAVKIQIYCSGIIFRDVLIATGKIPALSQIYEQQIGHEFAGLRADTGEWVMGFNYGKCVAACTRVDPYLFTTIPDNWSMEEAVTILSSYFTVWYGLLERAHIRRGESILIHSAAGGVGQAAINVCQHYGCDIYATVGTEEKKQFLINITGERVIGININNSVATSTRVDPYLFTTIPDNWSMEDAVTILSPYFTVWYGLIERAHIRQGESVLIHSAAGGVGQAAINVCQHLGCDIYATVGTEEKKQFLINTYKIPAKKIFSSRSIEFKSQVMRSTAGRGVDVVLNSLAGDKLDASYECVGTGGRFVELGKMDMFLNKKLPMYNLLRDLCIICVSLDESVLDRQYIWDAFYTWVHQNCSNGCVKPLNPTVFPAADAEKAFRYMTTGKHIGKIVIRIREEEANRKSWKCIKPANSMIVSTKTYFNPNKTYIITGGLGGFGLELCQWMVYNGAKRLVLTSRSGIKNDYQKFIVNRLIAFGKKHNYFENQVIVSSADCFTIEGTKQLLDECKGLGAPIGGVFHLALELNNCLFSEVSFETFMKTVDIKEKIFKNLDQLTRKLDYNLDHFVVFSSISSGFGFEGQLNYTYGNSICERICEQRQRDGLSGLAIQFGPVGDVGAMTELTQVFAFLTTQKQRIHSCCEVLDKLLAVKYPVITVNVKTVENSLLKLDSEAKEGSKSFINKLWGSLGIDPKATPADTTLGEIGIESIFASELQQELAKLCNQTIHLKIIKHMSVGLLREFESGGDDTIKAYFNGIKRAQISLSKYIFVIPVETHVRLNGVSNGKPLYLMPTLEM